MITIDVNAESFYEWANETLIAINTMKQTLTNIAKLIELETVPYVPLDTSQLEQSFEYVVSGTSPFFELRFGYDAEDEDSGFHYAEYQHKYELNHPKRGRSMYLTTGIYKSEGQWFAMLEQDYLSLLNGGRVSGGSIGSNTHAGFIKYMNM